ncbi:MAG: exopolysaccharide Pel transporter PelG [Clostridium sp.]|nr:exopolysaccharide Pel transporter PelG [Clostridium sp.]
MAGIGFELRRIFGKKTLVANTFGVIYASLTTVGPSIVFLMLLFSLRQMMFNFGIGEIDSMFFTFSFTYIFLLAILNSAFQNGVLSRYLSDKIFEQKEDDISASMFGMLTVSSVVASIQVTVLCVLMYQKDQFSLLFLVAYYLLGILATASYNLITYISALKEYKKVTLAYFMGVLIIFMALFVFHKSLNLPLILATYWALVVGFFVMNVMLIMFSVKAFGNPSEHYFEFLMYFKKHPLLIISSFAWILGFYVSNIIYWFLSDMKETVSIFSTAPNYDLAIFISIFINLSGMIIFEVKTETRFYDKYIAYLSALNSGIYKVIERERVSLQNTINIQLFFVYEVQLIITVILIFLVNIFYPYLGVNSQVLNMFLLTGLGLYTAFCMYFTTVFLYYFDDHISACIGPSVFFGVVVIGALICSRIGAPYYPIPLLIGGISGWIVSFILLRKRMKNLNAYLLCH